MKRITVATTLVLGALFFLATQLPGQNSHSPKLALSKDEVPIIFLLGEYDRQYEALASSQTTLLDVCDRDMNFAYTKLMGMMREMESYANQVGFELKGISAWMHFFWQMDGSVDHIAFHLKPNSRNVNIESFKAFLEGFAKHYKMPLKSNKKFSHYSSFSFPLAKQTAIPFDNTKATAKASHIPGN